MVQRYKSPHEEALKQIEPIDSSQISPTLAPMCWLNTIEDCYSRQLSVGDEVVFVEVEEMDGEWGLLEEASVRTSGGWLLVYSITDRSSFKSAQNWAKRLGLNVTWSMIDKFWRAVGGSLLRPNPCFDKLNSEGQAFAAKFGTVYIETSAKLDVNVDMAFVQLIKHIKQHENRIPSGSRTGITKAILPITKEKRGSIGKRLAYTRPIFRTYRPDGL
ncbi:1905_t:CDS:2 [Acaulospora colombiana]|uniref:1905_t:CDS:1 n=1 Tax=Acaulospora colombiana TaxID=27376 RepID=A0ACA9M5U3_9GLOM|nr:1905_t:CDS:2 [Acaulospora colombiana]